jgi:hypothetical protein
MKKTLLALAAMLTFGYANAQMKLGNNPTTTNSNALLEMETTNKGFLMPRVALTSTTAFAPLSAHVAGIAVYNTATAGDVTPGFYVNDGTKWVKLADAASITTPQAVSANCVGFGGIFNQNVALTNGTYSVTLSNDAFSSASLSFATSDLVLSGVSGYTVSGVSPATATLAAGASVTVVYTLSGTCTTSGTLQGNWHKVSLNCSNSQVIATPPPAITTLACASGVSAPVSAIQGQAFTGTITIPYTGGNSAYYSGLTVNSTGPGTLTNNLGGNIVFDVSGTTDVTTGAAGYTASGLANGADFSFTFGGQTCTYSVIVIPNIEISYTNTNYDSNNGAATNSTQSSPVVVANTSIYTATSYHNAGTSRILFPYKGKYRITYSTQGFYCQGYVRWQTDIQSPSISGNANLYYDNQNGLPVVTKLTNVVNAAVQYQDVTQACSGCSPNTTANFTGTNTITIKLLSVN